MHEDMASGGARQPDVAVRGTSDLSRFADLAGVRLYRRNIFAVTGLPADAQGRAVRSHRQRLDARLAVEETWPGDTDSPLVGGHRKDEVRIAFEEFQDPRRRLVDELLWRWGDTDFGCGCPAAVHQGHDAAVRFHALVLEAEAGRVEATTDERDRLWSGAAVHWSELLERPEFRRHIAHRIRALDDPRLTEHSAYDFLDGLPRLIASPFTELADRPGVRPRLARVCAGWAEHAPFSELLPEVFEERVEAAIEKIHEGRLSARDKMNAQMYGDAVDIMREKVLPEFEGLEPFRAFIPEWRYEEIAHAVAVALNNLAVALLEYHRLKPPSAEQRKTVVELAEKAYEIAPERDVAGIKANWDVIYEQFTRSGRRAVAKSSPRSGQPAVAKSSPRKKLGLGIYAFLVVMAGFIWGPAGAVVAALGLLVAFGYLFGA
ncbi:hypothetical protein [Streptomyces yerevanensis]|uniref:hypothetical protein n=1 Tax=Streptomyces yerevanensis TaxID=66378 RepID=UPI00068E97BE|nr:hypothetical protein [Streptomyces yerevanensis]